ncbi:hypothetical protein BAUCODRAFT_345442 [Baudoinia panamericana UAMH 10762]|uniref:Uncharacterized protein n=1 Tax=Baudoinia panamericana (strain UAMH 10762) TaxID=717646 RepID=M2N6H4_BAUPA|nr:uncharacterized protein BAUCODRAFT_345442 [Baudoinia panamericana UAMH 10762]EMC99678.1 hypothetical protein BAUCODRAFT_345442 [Baudoinia panamericana UAMH 10762]
MPSQRRQQYSTVEVRPEALNAKSGSTPASPGSPKKVAFAPCAKADSRTLSPVEAWSLYYFEAHAVQCLHCRNPLDMHLHGRRLCATGHSLAQDVAEHVYRQDGVVYSRKKDNHKLVSVEIPPHYTQVPQFLRVMERGLRTTHRTAPIINYDPNYVVSPRRTNEADAYESDDDRTEVIIKPARTESKSHRKSRHEYRTVVIDEDVEDRSASRPTPGPKERRGSIYYEDLAKSRKEAYHVEIRKPEGERRRPERPKSGFWA